MTRATRRVPLRRAVAGTVLLIVTTPGLGAAQGQQRRGPFVEGAAFVDFELRDHTKHEPPLALNDDAGATVPGAGVSAGTFVAPRVSVRVEVVVPGSFDSSAALGSTSYTREERALTASILAGYHSPPTARVRFGYLAGLAIVRVRVDTVAVISGPELPPAIPAYTERRESTSVGYAAAPALGFDAQIDLAAHLSLVPQLRVVAFTGALSIRPGIAVRWTH